MKAVETGNMFSCLHCICGPQGLKCGDFHRFYNKVLQYHDVLSVGLVRVFENYFNFSPVPIEISVGYLPWKTNQALKWITSIKKT